MQKLNSNLFTKSELAVALAVTVNKLTHLQDEHGLEFLQGKGRSVATVEEALEALTECNESCGTGIEEHIDVDKLAPKRPVTKDELKQRAVDDGLLSSKIAGELAAERMSDFPGMDSAGKCLAALLKVGLVTARNVGKARYFKRDEVIATIERWLEFNTPTDQDEPEVPEVQAQDTQPDVKPSDEKPPYIRYGAVFSFHIAVRFGISTTSTTSAPAFASRLRSQGLQDLGRDGRNYMYDPNVVDAIAAKDPSGEWPDHVTITPCSTVAKFLRAKGQQADRKVVRNFEEHIRVGEVDLYRHDQPWVYRVADLEALWLTLISE